MPRSKLMMSSLPVCVCVRTSFLVVCAVAVTSCSSCFIKACCFQAFELIGRIIDH